MKIFYTPLGSITQSTPIKQNRESTEGCSKSIVQKNNDKFGKKDWFQQVEHMQVPKGQDQQNNFLSITPKLTDKAFKN